VNHLEILNFQNYFIDFNKNKFENEQAKMIFDEIGNLLERKDYINAKKHCNEMIIDVNYSY
jgi:hypothetical protein